MAAIEILTFRLAEGTDEVVFLAADRRVQTQFAYHQPGIVRRTTARGVDGEWLVLSVWATVEDAAAAVTEAIGHPAVTEFQVLLDHSSLRIETYETLD